MMFEHSNGTPDGEKLIRDRDPEILRGKGITMTTRIERDDEKFLQLLFRKLEEEAAEVVGAAEEKSSEKFIKELADVRQVLESIRIQLKISPDHIDISRAESDPSASPREQFRASIAALYEHAAALSTVSREQVPLVMGDILGRVENIIELGAIRDHVRNAFKEKLGRRGAFDKRIVWNRGLDGDLRK